MTKFKLIKSMLLFFVIVLLAGTAWSDSGYTYKTIFEEAVSEIKISPDEKNKVKCFEIIKDIDFDNGKVHSLELNGDTATFQYSGPDTLMTVRTSNKKYSVILKSDKDAGPKVLVARWTSSDENLAHSSEYLSTDRLNYVYISKKGINRITCDSDSVGIKNIIIPKNSGIKIEKDDREAYVQYKGTDDVVIHISATSGKVYSVCLKPEEVEAKTLILKNSKKFQPESFKSNVYEQIVVDLIKTAVTNIEQFIDSKISDKQQEVVTVDQIQIVEWSRYQFASNNNILMIEYHLMSEKKVKINEAYLYDNYFKTVDPVNIMGLGMNDDNVIPNFPTKLFVVFKNRR